MKNTSTSYNNQSIGYSTPLNRSKDFTINSKKKFLDYFFTNKLPYTVDIEEYKTELIGQIKDGKDRQKQIETLERQISLMMEEKAKAQLTMQQDRFKEEFRREREQLERERIEKERKEAKITEFDPMGGDKETDKEKEKRRSQMKNLDSLDKFQQDFQTDKEKTKNSQVSMVSQQDKPTNKEDQSQMVKNSGYLLSKHKSGSGELDFMKAFTAKTKNNPMKLFNNIDCSDILSQLRLRDEDNKNPRLLTMY